MTSATQAKHFPLKKNVNLSSYLGTWSYFISAVFSHIQLYCCTVLYCVLMAGLLNIFTTVSLQKVIQLVK